MTEDIDLFIEKMNFERFNTLWNRLTQEYECINLEDAKEAYTNYLLKNSALNFSIKNKYSLRMEVKFPKNDVDVWTLDNRKKVILNRETLFISPLELQITFKLWLGRQGNEKDIEDAKHVYNLFKEHLDKEVFMNFIRKFNIQDLYNKYLI